VTVETDKNDPLGAIGWRSGTPLPADASPDWAIARVTAQHRNGYELSTGSSEFIARPAPRFLRRDTDPTERPAVGDFVLVEAGETRIIQVVLPRRTSLSRAAAGERYQRQIIATNIDTVFVLTGLDGDYNPRRIERYLTLVQGSGAIPVVVLTKADKLDADTLEATLDSLRSQLPAHLDVLAINAKSSDDIAPLRAYVRHGDTAVLVGSSGAGKSTLTNTLLGRERQATSAVREHDSRGRHTTVHRSLLALPDGGCLIDTPGMRELKLTGEEDVVAATFTDIDALAQNCRFADCRHGNEPGCAVRAALESGVLDSARWESFCKLRDELAAASDSLAVQLERKANARVMNKALGKRLVDKYGRR
jgi:ribosome biogenesis GTPase / thiamine phosphate phosphatase